MLKGLGDIGNLMKIQMKIKDMQKQMKKMEATAVSDDSMITATINGEFLLKSVSVNEEKLKASDKKQIEKSIVNAVNKAVEMNKAAAAEKMKEVTGGLNIPGLDGLM
jgi:nucleoid-associated protein EbfC